MNGNKTLYGAGSQGLLHHFIRPEQNHFLASAFDGLRRGNESPQAHRSDKRNLFHIQVNLFRLKLPSSMRSEQIETLRIRLFKIGASIRETEGRATGRKRNSRFLALGIGKS
jgi:hypothetical protein